VLVVRHQRTTTQVHLFRTLAAVVVVVRQLAELVARTQEMAVVPREDLMQLLIVVVAVVVREVRRLAVTADQVKS